MNALRDAFPEDGIVVLEAPSATLAVRNQLRISRPGATTSAPAAAWGSGSPRRWACSSHSPTGRSSAWWARGLRSTRSRRWSAAAYSAPITVLVLRNSEYAILKWFADIEGVGGAPGLDLPSLSCLAVADGYGVPAREVAGSRALRDAVAAGEPRLVEVPGGARNVAVLRDTRNPVGPGREAEADKQLFVAVLATDRASDWAAGTRSRSAPT